MHPRQVSKKRPDLLDLATLACESRVKMSNKDLLHCCSCFRNEAPHQPLAHISPHADRRSNGPWSVRPDLAERPSAQPVFLDLALKRDARDTKRGGGARHVATVVGKYFGDVASLELCPRFS